MLTSQIVFQILLRDDSTESVGIALHSIKPSTYKNKKILLNESWSISEKEKRKPPAPHIFLSGKNTIRNCSNWQSHHGQISLEGSRRFA